MCDLTEQTQGLWQHTQGEDPTNASAMLDRRHRRWTSVGSFLCVSGYRRLKVYGRLMWPNAGPTYVTDSEPNIRHPLMGRVKGHLVWMIDTKHSSRISFSVRLQQ